MREWRRGERANSKWRHRIDPFDLCHARTAASLSHVQTTHRLDTQFILPLECSWWCQARMLANALATETSKWQSRQSVEGCMHRPIQSTPHGVPHSLHSTLGYSSLTHSHSLIPHSLTLNRLIVSAMSCCSMFRWSCAESFTFIVRVLSPNANRNRCRKVIIATISSTDGSHSPSRRNTLQSGKE